MKKYNEDFKFSKREFRRRKYTLSFLGSVVDQLIYEGRKLLPVAQKFHKMNNDEKRRYTEAITAIQVWVDNMADLAYGDGSDDIEINERTF